MTRKFSVPDVQFLMLTRYKELICILSVHWQLLLFNKNEKYSKAWPATVNLVQIIFLTFGKKCHSTGGMSTGKWLRGATTELKNLNLAHRTILYRKEARIITKRARALCFDFPFGRRGLRDSWFELFREIIALAHFWM